MLGILIRIKYREEPTTTDRKINSWVETVTWYTTPFGQVEWQSAQNCRQMLDASSWRGICGKAGDDYDDGSDGASVAFNSFVVILKLPN